MTRFYKWPRLLFAPNPDLVDELETATGKPCFLMSHSVDTEIFNPGFRDRCRGDLSDRLCWASDSGKECALAGSTWKSGLLPKGYDDFEMVIVGDGAEESWLRRK